MNSYSTEIETRLTELIKIQLEYFKQLQEQTKKQSAMIEADDIDELDRSLEVREEIIEKINDLHQESDFLMQSYLSHPETHKNKELDELINKLHNIILECTTKNEENIALLNTKTDEHRVKMKKQRRHSTHTLLTSPTTRSILTKRHNAVFDCEDCRDGRPHSPLWRGGALAAGWLRI